MEHYSEKLDMRWSTVMLTTYVNAPLAVILEDSFSERNKYLLFTINTK